MLTAILVYVSQASERAMLVFDVLHLQGLNEIDPTLRRFSLYQLKI